MRYLLFLALTLGILGVADWSIARSSNSLPDKYCSAEGGFLVGQLQLELDVDPLPCPHTKKAKAVLKGACKMAAVARGDCDGQKNAAGQCQAEDYWVNKAACPEEEEGQYDGNATPGNARSLIKFDCPQRVITYCKTVFETEHDNNGNPVVVWDCVPKIKHERCKGKNAKYEWPTPAC